MHYPWWYVPVTTAPMLIAIIATIHIWVSLYAVGGGIILAYENKFARDVQQQYYREYLKSHLWFFTLITVVYGAITGVGIWWIIGLTSPLATQALIHIFVFGWAMEYVFFIIEIVSAFIFYYYWDKLDDRTHITIGWIYGISAWMSLVLITGITAFQINSGGWKFGDSFWSAFFNPETIPQIIARTGGSLLLASLYIYLHASYKLQNNRELKDFITYRLSKWILGGSVLTALGGIFWYLNVPESARAALEGASALTVMAGLITMGTILMIAITYFGSSKHPGWLSRGFAIVLFFGGLANVTMGEFIREAVRKPYIVENIVLGNQIYKHEIPQLQSSGYLNGGTWTKYYVSQLAPSTIDAHGNIDYKKFQTLTGEQKLRLGKTLFMYHCNDCHAAEKGVSGVQSLTRGWSDEMMKTAVLDMDKLHYFMPPWCGTPEEAELLAGYLNSIKLPSPR